MSNDDNWTPVVGWTRAAVQIPIRAVVAVALAWAGLWLLKAIIASMEKAIAQEITVIGMGLIVLIGVVFGVAGGVALARKLSEQTGLIGSHLIVPVCGLFVVGLALLDRALVSTAPDWQQISAWLFMVTAVAGCAYAVKQLLLDS